MRKSDDLQDWRKGRGSKLVAPSQPLFEPPTIKTGVLSTKQRKVTPEMMHVEAAAALTAAGNSTRDVVAVTRELMRRSTLVLCPLDPVDEPHVAAFLEALKTFAGAEALLYRDTRVCLDCPSIGCNPKTA